MSDRTRQILSCYESENPGVRANLARMMNHGTLAGTGRMVILPVDQGFEHGPARSFAPNPPDTTRTTTSSWRLRPGATRMPRLSGSSRPGRRPSPVRSR